jgi:hypothetical protein
MVVLFVGCTALGVWWAAPSADILSMTGRALANLGGGNLAWLVALGAGAIAAEMFRLYVFGKVSSAFTSAGGLHSTPASRTTCSRGSRRRASAA